MASTSSSGHAQCEHSDITGVVCRCQECKPSPRGKLSEKHGGAGESAADGCQESSQSTVSWRACGVCECHQVMPGNVSAFGDEPARPLSEHFQGIPHVVSTTSTVMVPSSTFVSVTTWLLEYLRYTCGLLGYLASCLPSIGVNEHEEADETNNDVNHDPGSLPSVDGSNIADSEHNLEPKHKIFLSHSGAQKDFVEQLCVDLERCDRYPFFDKLRSSLPIGEKFPKLIFDAIEQCHVGVVVLSEEFFTRTKWPMLELIAMVKEFGKSNSRIRIIPVYYLISLEALKDPKNHGRWKLKWEEWALRDKRIKVKDWEEAIRVLGAISSLVIKDAIGDVKFREEIVTEICRLIPLETRWDDSHVQGRSRTCQTIQDKMDRVCASSSVGVVGLYGTGGIGKTTICKALCNDLSKKFHDNVCHIELRSINDMELLRKALKKLTEIRHDILDKLDDFEQGLAFFKKKLRSKPMFFALDNVQDDHKSIGEAQTYLRASFEPDSIVLITARSLDVLKKLNLDESQCLEMPELEEEEARSLFLYHAHISTKDEVSEELIRDCINRCHFLKSNGSCRHYHPLALKVLGQQFGPKSSTWAGQLYKIDTFNQSGDMNHPVFSILRTSFDSLKYEHQLIWMDIALFSPYEDTSLTSHTMLDWLCMMHEEFAEDMKHLLEILERKSLLEDLDGGFTKIGVHDLWREFAVAEIRAKDLSNQCWVYLTDGKRVIRSGRWRENVQRMCFLKEGWRGLNGLNLTDFVNVEAFKLRAGIWMELCELDLDLSGFKHLKSLDVYTSSLTISVNGLSSLTNLGYLSWSVPGFSPCIDEIGCLTNLQVLELLSGDGVHEVDVVELIFLLEVRIGSFPDLITVRGLSSRLVNLRSLAIECCKSLRECPGVGELFALEDLCLLECGNLEELPCLGCLTNLKVLEISKCKSIRAVPGLSDLVALERFCAKGCSKLATLPGLVKLTKLQTLDISWCPMQELAGLDGLISLTRLSAFLGELSVVPPTFMKLSALKELEIYGWNGPICTSIRSLLMLEDLRLIKCVGEDVVPDLQNLERLKLVCFGSCDYKDLSGLSTLTALETLWIHDCYKLERLPEFERLTKLTDLSIIGCNDLRDWPTESTLCSLKSLKADGLSLMRVVQGLNNLPSLRALKIWDGELEKVLIMASLTSQLKILVITFFETMEALDISNFSQLEKLKLLHCSALTRVTCSKPLVALTELKVADCESLVEMPDLSTLPHLEELRLKRCMALTRLTCSRPVTALKMIILTGCDSLVEMPDKSMFLKFLSFERYYGGDSDNEDEDDEDEDEDEDEDNEDEDEDNEDEDEDNEDEDEDNEDEDEDNEDEDEDNEDEDEDNEDEDEDEDNEDEDEDEDNEDDLKIVP